MAKRRQGGNLCLKADQRAVSSAVIETVSVLMTGLADSKAIADRVGPADAEKLR